MAQRCFISEPRCDVTPLYYFLEDKNSIEKEYTLIKVCVFLLFWWRETVDVLVLVPSLIENLWAGFFFIFSSFVPIYGTTCKFTSTLSFERDKSLLKFYLPSSKQLLFLLPPFPIIYYPV